MKIAVYGSRRQEAYLGQIRAFLENLGHGGHEVVMHAKLYKYLLHIMPEALAVVRRVTDTSDFSADFAVSIGGDGSFLRTAAWVADKEIPIIGVNTGHLGFLASLHIGELPQLHNILIDENFRISSRSLIAVECTEPIQGWPYALNEVTFGKAESSSIINVRASIDGCPLASYRADGLIVSTPTGSTAYNLSVGGPIVQPEAPVMIISPIAAHSLSMRPLVVADSSVLTCDVESRVPSFRLSIDGRATVLGLEARISLRRAPFVVNVVEFPGHNFAETLRTKLAWG